MLQFAATVVILCGGSSNAQSPAANLRDAAAIEHPLGTLYEKRDHSSWTALPAAVPPQKIPVSWMPEDYTFNVDGVQTWKTNAGGVSQVAASLGLKLEFSQGWNGDIAKAELPDQFIVDDVRVYRSVKQ